jgi:gliding motility-associated lipoprotein GldH
MRNFLVFLVIASLFSCDNIIYENYYSFNEGVWDADSTVNFEYTISDTLSLHDLSLSIRHSVDYEYQNLFLFLESDTKDTIEIMLADKSGKWYGRGISNIRELNYTLQTSKMFDKKGKYYITFEQAMRYGAGEKIQHLENITDIGLIISKHND